MSLKNYMLLFIVIFSFLFALPICVSRFAPTANENSLVEEESHESQTDTPVSVLSVIKDGTVTNMTVEDWVSEALSYELPREPDPEFAKAMATVFRTYAIYHTNQGDKRQDHPESDLCSDPSHCKGLTSEYSNEFTSFAKATEGKCIYFNRQHINPIVHISSSVKTASALEAFGVDVPYLQSVDTPDESSLNGFSDSFTFTKAQLEEKLKENGIETSGKTENWITYISYTESGRVSTVSVCGKTVSGSVLAKMLSLPSLNFTIKAGSENITFETEGIGSGVGLSEYGAYIMGTNGSTFEEIIEHYYQGAYIG